MAHRFENQFITLSVQAMLSCILCMAEKAVLTGERWSYVVSMTSTLKSTVLEISWSELVGSTKAMVGCFSASATGFKNIEMALEIET